MQKKKQKQRRKYNMFALKKVCNQCPFRRDSMEGWLGEKRITEIIDETVKGNGYFVCHKTLHLDKDEQKLCAGKLILEGKVNAYGNSSTRVGMAFGLVPRKYDQIEGAELVFESAEECIQHHAEGWHNV